MTKEFYIKYSASGKWKSYTLLEQMANIGSEVGRTIKWLRAKDKERFESCFERALELFDLTLEDDRWKGRRKEIARSREYFCMLITAPERVNDIEKEFNSFNEYFLQFGIAARLNKSAK